jgi:hypothetical protein
MWDYIHDKVVAEMGWLLPLAPRAPEQLANQLVNCFAFDQILTHSGVQQAACSVGAVNAERWEDPGAGRAVSPDNILLWDPPTDDHGVYGYSERLVYRSGGWKRIYHWAPSEGAGMVEGTVTYLGQPVGGARVILAAAGGLEAESGPDGHFRFLAVPAGIYEIDAQVQLPDVFLSTRDQTVAVVQDQTASVELLLEPPAEEFRQVIFTDNLYHSGGQEPDPENTWPHYHGFYHEDIQWGFMCYGTKRWEINDIVAGEGELSCRVDPTNPTDLYWWRHCLGNSCFTVSGSCELDPETMAVHVTVNGSWGGEPATRHVDLAPGESEPLEWHFYKQDNCIFTFWDKFEIWVELTNTVQNY